VPGATDSGIKVGLCEKIESFTTGPLFPLLFCPLMSLMMHLKEYRQWRSVLDHVPIYYVFGDTVMRSIAQTRPLTEQALLGIRGFNEDKCQRYGAEVLRLVAGSKAEPLNTTSLRRRAVPTVHASPVGICVWSRGSAVRKRVAAAPKVHPKQGKLKREDQIYIMELAKGRVYVGRTSDLRRRVAQHSSGKGSAFTQAFAPTGTMLPRLGCVSGSAEAAERDETLRYMFLRGIDLVRGWKYTRVVMPSADHRDAEENIRELFDLCRRCGRPGHFITQCKAVVDRLGRTCGKC
jgi:predicted GIY-YIG superfamily endonuclease